MDHAGEGSPGDVRVSDEERQRVVRHLSEQAGAGRLTLAEHEERVGLVYEAATRAELDRIVADLPAVPSPAPVGEPPTTRRRPTRWVVSVMGGTDKKGRWRVGDRVNVVTVMGGNDIDLRRVELDRGEVTIVAVAVMGGIDIYVPDSVDVEVGGFALMGGNDERGSGRAPRPGAPRVHVRAYGLMGGIDVWRVPEEAAGLGLREARQVARDAESGVL